MKRTCVSFLLLFLIGFTCILDETGERASHIMKMVALRFHLHPLALEDSLKRHNQLAKAESYTGHYFIVVPVFYLEYEENVGVSSQPQTGTWWKKCCQRVAKAPSADAKKDATEDRPRVSGIGLQMTSIFVTMPTGKTVITFNKQSGDHKPVADCWSRVQSELEKSYSKLRQFDGQYLCYSLLDQAVHAIGPIVKEVGDAITEEKKALRMRNYKDMRRIHTLRDELKSMARKLKPVKNLFMHVIEDKTISSGP